MFAQDQKAISLMAKKSVEFTNWLIVMVLVSIRTPWYNIVTNMLSVKRYGAKSPILNNKTKNKGYKYIRRNSKKLHNIIFCTHMTTAEKLVALTEIPNIHLVKAGFILQLCLGEVGCIDCHNAVKYDIDLEKFKWGTNASIPLKLKKAQQYVEVCDKVNTCAEKWDVWCVDRFEADQRTQADNRYRDEHHVSRLHVDAIVSVARAA